MSDHYDVLIIGAGLSGIGAACHLAMDAPRQRVGILERRHAIGGTWDLFRYPGIRSDSDMCSFGFKFRPWNELRVLADGPGIRQYVADTARQYGVDKKIRFGLKTTHAEWCSQEQRWTVTAVEEATGQTQTFSARFLVGATGYYNYDQGYLPAFPGIERFKGQRIHPQFWPENLDYRGKRVVVIGSGATAMTLVPAMAGQAAHVTMLQRSPTYVFSLPGYDKISEVLQKFLPERVVFAMARKRNILFQRYLYKAAKRWPERVRRVLLAGVKRQLGDKVDMKHFSPSYMPWDQRLCAVPDADLFKAIRSGKASVVTDRIKTFDETGIVLESGEHLDADIVITATGLQLQLLGGMELRVDGQVPAPAQLMTYKGTLMQDMPNMAFILGYTNAPWTLKADMASDYIVRLINHMEAKGLAVATPRAPAGMVQDEENILGSLGSGYVQRAARGLPRQGRDLPWRVLHHYEKDQKMLMDAAVDDGLLEFTAKKPAPAAAVSTPMAA